MTLPRTLGSEGGRKSLQSFAAPQVVLGQWAHARAIGTRPSFLLLPGLGTRLMRLCVHSIHYIT